jgi:hypothetical protein
MKTTTNSAILVLTLGLIICLAAVANAAPTGTAFTYQGRLMDANTPADGLYDFSFGLWSDPCDVNEVYKIGENLNIADWDVIDGYFTVELDFNDVNAFNGERRWLEIGIRPGELGDPNVYTTLGWRTEIMPAPYALALPGLRTEQNATSTNLIGGYIRNKVTGGVIGAVIGGGGENGFEHNVTDNYSTIGGGRNNQAGDDTGTADDASYATVGGGSGNVADGKLSTIGGGLYNKAEVYASTVAGGQANSTILSTKTMALSAGVSRTGCTSNMVQLPGVTLTLPRGGILPYPAVITTLLPDMKASLAGATIIVQEVHTLQ